MAPREQRTAQQLCRSKSSPPTQRWETGEGTLSPAEDFWPKARHVTKQNTHYTLSVHELWTLPPGIQRWPRSGYDGVCYKFIFYFLWLPNFLQPPRPRELGMGGWELGNVTFPQKSRFFTGHCFPQSTGLYQRIDSESPVVHFS